MVFGFPLLPDLQFPLLPDLQRHWLRAMDTFDVALTFADSAHGGDRRKKSQQCGFSWDLDAIFVCCPQRQIYITLWPRKTPFRGLKTFTWKINAPTKVWRVFPVLMTRSRGRNPKPYWGPCQGSKGPECQSW